MLARVDGVEDASVNFATGVASLALRPGAVGRDQLTTAVERAGFSVPDDAGDEDLAALAAARAQRQAAEAAGLRADMLLAVALALPVVALGMVWMAWTPGRWISAVLTTLILARPGRRFFEDAVKVARAGATNMNVNSIGSVMPVRNDVNAIDTSRPPTALRRPGFTERYIARQAAGRPNIITGKKPVMKAPAVGSPAK